MNTGTQKGLDQEVRVLGSHSVLFHCAFSASCSCLGVGVPVCALRMLWGLLGACTRCQAWTRLCWSFASNRCSLGAYQLDCFLNGDSLRDFVLKMLFFLTLSCEVSDQAARFT